MISPDKILDIFDKFKVRFLNLEYPYAIKDKERESLVVFLKKFNTLKNFFSDFQKKVASFCEYNELGNFDFDPNLIFPEKDGVPLVDKFFKSKKYLFDYESNLKKLFSEFIPEGPDLTKKLESVGFTKHLDENLNSIEDIASFYFDNLSESLKIEWDDIVKYSSFKVTSENIDSFFAKFLSDFSIGIGKLRNNILDSDLNKFGKLFCIHLNERYPKFNISDNKDKNVNYYKKYLSENLKDKDFTLDYFLSKNKEDSRQAFIFCFEKFVDHGLKSLGLLGQYFFKKYVHSGKYDALIQKN